MLFTLAEPFDALHDLPPYVALILVVFMGAAYLVKATKNENGKEKDARPPQSGELSPQEWELRIGNIVDDKVSRRLQLRNAELMAMWREVRAQERDECEKQVRIAVQEEFRRNRT
jgi:hypothetical protein